MGLEEELSEFEQEHAFYAGIVQSAKNARLLAYAPYSKYTVGAAVHARHPANGAQMIFSGCNVENASYGLTMCAERTAIFNAVTAGFTEIGVMAIATENGGMSCGACRQVEHEFNPDLTIISVDDRDTWRIFNLREELPHAFGPEYLEK